MPNLKFGGNGFYKKLTSFAEDAEGSTLVEEIVGDILTNVRDRGNKAVLEYTLKLDQAALTGRTQKVTPKEMQQGEESFTPAESKAIRDAIRAVKTFNKRSVPQSWSETNQHGATVGENYYPLNRVGIYIPGGTVPLVSTVVMTVTLAKIAGVPEICVCTPPNNKGKIQPQMLGVLSLCGIKEIYKVGGAQAIAAMAYGTDVIAKVDKIYGPGNAFVNEAKRQLFGKVGIDLLPGPSELMVIVDKTAEAKFVAADLLAQAEHGSGKEKIYLVSTSQEKTKEIEACIVEQLPNLSNKEAISKVLAKGFLKISVPKLSAAVEVANFVAPEHMELQIAENLINSTTKKITTAGAILQGNYSATALGDFVAGPSHVLPTGRVGRFLSGLTIGEFFRRSSVLSYKKEHVKKAASAVAVFSRLEKLDAHGRSVSIRVD